VLAKEEIRWREVRTRRVGGARECFSAYFQLHPPELVIMDMTFK
jgi:hypothetical protein